MIALGNITAGQTQAHHLLTGFYALHDNNQIQTFGKHNHGAQNPAIGQIVGHVLHKLAINFQGACG